MKWEYYSKRRNVSLVDFIKKRDIESYEMLTEVLSEKEIAPPPHGMFQSAYAIAFPPVPKTTRTKPAKKKAPARKPVSRSKTVKKPATKSRARKK